MILALLKGRENELEWVQNNFRLFLVYFLASRKIALHVCITKCLLFTLLLL